jgi:hypothetical protein
VSSGNKADKLHASAELAANVIFLVNWPRALLPEVVHQTILNVVVLEQEVMAAGVTFPTMVEPMLLLGTCARTRRGLDAAMAPWRSARLAFGSTPPVPPVAPAPVLAPL